MNVTLVNNEKRDWNISEKPERTEVRERKRDREKERRRFIFCPAKMSPLPSQEQKENHTEILFQSDESEKCDVDIQGNAHACARATNLTMKTITARAINKTV